MESSIDVTSDSDTLSTSQINGNITTERKQQQATKTLSTRSWNKGVASDLHKQSDAAHFKADNDQLRKKVKYMENLGVLVTGYKQENQNLIQENFLLRKRMEELNTNGIETDASSGSTQNRQKVSCYQSNGNNVIDQSPPSSSPDDSGQGAVFSNHNSSLSEKTKERMKAQDADDTDVERVASLFLTQAVDAPSSSENQDVMSKEDPPGNEVLREQSAFNNQIAELEEMVGLRHPSNSSDASITEPSVTSQFTKLAAVFASLAQRVVCSQKRASKSQAFCDALMAENEKMKNLLNQAHRQLDTLKRENEDFKEKKKSSSSGHASPVQTKTCVKLNTSASSAKAEPDSAIILKLQARVKKLEKQRIEILRVNKSWDVQYKKLRQELDRRTREWEDKTSGPDVPSCSRTQHSQDVYQDRVSVAELKKEIREHIENRATLARNFSAAHGRCQELKSDIARLTETERKLKEDKSCLEAENARLNQALEAAYSIQERKSISITEDHGCENNNFSPSRSSNGALREGESTPNDDLQVQVEVLLEQVKIYREDFETERRDREKNQSEKQRLDEALTVARHEVQALSQQVRTLQQDFRQERMDKERFQRQCQGSHRDKGRARNRARYHVAMNEPPAYYRFPDDDDLNLFNQPQYRGRSRRSPPRYEYGMNPQNWSHNGAVDGDVILSYPPEGAAERPY